MNKKIRSNFFLRINFIVFFVLNFSLNAQNFERIERIAGLNALEENNGVAVADIDGDLDLDLFVVAKGKDESGKEKSFSKLFRNNNDGSFTDITKESGLTNLFPIEEIGDKSPALAGFKYGASWGDYDNDGFPDLFLTNLFKVQLFHNQGDGTFVEKTTESGIKKINNCWNTGATWFDFNNDGFLDIYINDWGYCDFNSFYINNGDGTFRNASDIFAISAPKRRTYMALPFDFNSDGWMDLYVSVDDNYANEVYLNANGISVTENAEEFGLDHVGNDMGIGIGDFDNNGFFDFFVTDIDNNTFFQNNGNNSFTDIAPENRMNNTGWAWDNVFADFDLDGDEDLFIANGFSLSNAQNNTYYQNRHIEDQSGFLDISEGEKLNESTISTGATPFDYDNDGDLDLFVTNADRASYFYENKRIENGKSHQYNWFKISLQGTTSNRDAIGTTISISTDKGDLYRYYTGLGFLSQSLKVVHFGLGEATTINEVKIKWPSGLEETYNDINSNSFIKATEGVGFEILNSEPSIKIFGCTDPNSCNYNPLATASDDSCAYLTPKEIIGPTSSAFNNKESYSYTLEENRQIQWSVEGGTIIDGQGTSSIQVKWGLEEQGFVRAKESNDICTSTLIELGVHLNVNEVPENVSIARIWNEALLEAIRNDFARPNVHARNLFHTSIALFDTWASFNENAKPYLIGNNIHNFNSHFDGFTPNEDIETAREKAMSFAAYRLLKYRFKNSPGVESSSERFDFIMEQLGYDSMNTSVDYSRGDAAALGNFVAQTIINYGKIDGSREASDYDNAFYKPINPPLNLFIIGETTGIIDPNRWQPLTFSTFIDQSGNLIIGSTPDFLGPEWGSVNPFALLNDSKSVFDRDGNSYTVYHDPGAPPQLNLNSETATSNYYKWNFSLVSIWSSHLDPKDGVQWDISPRTIGNIDIGIYPKSFADYDSFYKEIEGGDISKGHSINPSTGNPYEVQMVPRADYARVLAEFWADGPDSETPPGHWFTILNYVSDHPFFERKFNGKGEKLSALEWDVKSYFILSGAMHDAAISAWGVKGWYDYIRPISAIRYMSELGQSTNKNLDNYDVGGIPLKNGYIEIVEEGDPLSGINNEHIGKIKVYAWKGHDYISNSRTDVAGVDWILAENWWPYQRPSFVTPPFAGFVSGHSTYSRAAAEVMTLMTGDEFFPGGMGEFIAKKDEFLVFEKGPSTDVVLQWATYRDASDQTSLSRIWGGIHPPADDIPGRIIGEKVGIDAYNFAVSYFNSENQFTPSQEFVIYPNPVNSNEIFISKTNGDDSFAIFDQLGKSIPIYDKQFNGDSGITKLKIPNSLASGIYFLKVNNNAKLLYIN